MTNASFPCSIDRIRGPLGASDQMYLINHNLDFGEGSILLPNRFVAATTNGISSCVGSSTLLISARLYNPVICCVSVWQNR